MSYAPMGRITIRISDRQRKYIAALARRLPGSRDNESRVLRLLVSYAEVHKLTLDELYRAELELNRRATLEGPHT